MSIFALKIIACITMFIDHIGAFLLNPETELYFLFRVIGRLAFPIFAFCFSETMKKTSNPSKLLKRLFFFAVISQIPYSWLNTGKFFNFYHLNVLWTFLITALAVFFYNKYRNKKYICVLSLWALSLFLCFLDFDYSFYGVLMILAFYAFWPNKNNSLFAFIALNILLVFIEGNVFQTFCAFSIFIIIKYNGALGPKCKWFFYVFYPAHLMLLCLIKLLAI